MPWENTINHLHHHHHHHTSLFSTFKPERPLIDIPPTAPQPGAAVVHGLIDPLRTPEDFPARHPRHHPPWDASQIDAMYHFTPFRIGDPDGADEHLLLEQHHQQHRFPDVEDTGWDLSLVSPPSPSRRTMVEMLPDVDGMQDPYDDGAMDMMTMDLDLDDDDDGPPMLSPPSPSRRTLALLPDTTWQQPSMIDDCPQLSPPSPIHCNSALPPLHPDFDTFPLFIEESLHTNTTASTPPPLPLSSPLYPHTAPPSALAKRLHTEHQALISLRDGTIRAERTSRARNVALRGRERELGRAVATLRDAPTHTCPASDDDAAAATATTTPCDMPAMGFSEGSSASDDSLPTPSLHVYRTLATTVMLERTEEKRRRKKDKERLKELRVILGVGVDALLYLAGDTDSYGNAKYSDAPPPPPSCIGDLGALLSSSAATTDLGIGPSGLTLLPLPLTLRRPEPCRSTFQRTAHKPEAPPLHEDPLPPLEKALHSESDMGGGGGGLGLDFSAGCLTPSPFVALAERMVAMRRLVARMTMRRRYLGMRSLIEAGNMSGGGVCGGGELLRRDSTSGVGAGTGAGATMSHKRKRVGSGLAREMIRAEELEAGDTA